VEGTVFSERLRQAIALAGTSRARLADSLCTARSAVNNWVKGKDMPAGMHVAACPRRSAAYRGVQEKTDATRFAAPASPEGRALAGPHSGQMH